MRLQIVLAFVAVLAGVPLPVHADGTQAPPSTFESQQPPVRPDEHGYVNSDGNWEPSPTHADKVPAGATAKCRDGTYSFSQHHRGTCSHHGGVAAWL